MDIQTYMFDAYGTLFDVHSVTNKIHEFYPDKGPAISQQWRSRQVHYFLVRQLIDGYQPFDQITRWALIDALSYNDIPVETTVVDQLMKQYEKLEPYPEVQRLAEKQDNQTMAIFSNGTHSMLEPLLEHNQLQSAFHLLSADDPGVYKPHREAYRFAQNKLGHKKEEILFFSSNPWDIAGAAGFGFRTAWVNRNKEKWPELGIKPSLIIEDLAELPK